MTDVSLTDEAIVRDSDALLATLEGHRAMTGPHKTVVDGRREVGYVMDRSVLDELILRARHLDRFVRARMAQRSQPLTDEMIRAEAASRDPITSLEYIERSVFEAGAKWARDQMAQQAQPEMPTREQIATKDGALYLRFADYGVVTTFTQSYVGGVVEVEMSDDDHVVGIRVARLGAIELQVLADVARTYDLNLDMLLASENDHE